MGVAIESGTARAGSAGLGIAWRAASLVMLLAVAYHRMLPVLWGIWTENENYSHGPLVPLVSLGMVWRGRDRLRSAIQPEGDRRGLALVALAGVMLVAGQRSAVFALQGYSLVLMIAGLVWALLGPAALRAAAFPIAFLLFMLPFPGPFVAQISYLLKEVTVRFSAAAAQGLGAALQREGMNLYLQEGVLRIENPCSGLRSLISLLATGALFAYVQPGAAWRKGVLFLSAVPLAMLGNAARITALVLVAHYVGIPQATGGFHDATGFVVFAAALAGMIGLRRLLAAREPAAEARP
jgi:exosortase